MMDIRVVKTSRLLYDLCEDLCGESLFREKAKALSIQLQGDDLWTHHPIILFTHYRAESKGAEAVKRPLNS